MVGPAGEGAGAAGAGAGWVAAEGGRRPGAAGGGAGGRRLHAFAHSAASSRRPEAIRRRCQERCPCFCRLDGLPSPLGMGGESGEGEGWRVEDIGGGLHRTGGLCREENY